MSSKKTELQLTFCCARGEYRGPALAEKVSSSNCIDGGYTGLADWLRQVGGRKEQIDALRMFYLGSYIALIVDEVDKKLNNFSDAVKFITTLLVEAGIPHGQYTYAALLLLIEDGEIGVLVESE